MTLIFPEALITRSVSDPQTLTADPTALNQMLPHRPVRFTHGAR